MKESRCGGHPGETPRFWGLDGARGHGQAGSEARSSPPADSQDLEH